MIFSSSQRYVDLADDEYRVFETDHVPENYLKDHVEDDRALNAIENCIEGFRFKYLHVQKGEKIIFSVPLFYLYFKLSTMLNFRWLLPLIREWGFQVACVGSPVSTLCRYEGVLDEKIVEHIFKYLKEKAPLVSFKGFEIRSDMNGFMRAHSMPLAQLQFSVERWAEFKKNRNIKRKLRASSLFTSRAITQLSAEELEQVYALYLNTYEQSEMQFGKVSKQYFEKSNSKSVFILAYLENRLVGFAQLFAKDHSASTTFMGMDYTVNSKLGLYFYIYFAILDYAERSGWNLIDFGETSYEFKRRIGCDIYECWVYYKHRNCIMNWLISKLKFLVEPASTEIK